MDKIKVYICIETSPTLVPCEAEYQTKNCNLIEPQFGLIIRFKFQSNQKIQIKVFLKRRKNNEMCNLCVIYVTFEF